VITADKSETLAKENGGIEKQHKSSGRVALLISMSSLLHAHFSNLYQKEEPPF